MPRFLKYLLICFCLAVMAACNGCAIPAAAIVTSAAGAVPVAAEQFGDGRTDSFWLARYEDVVAAAQKAGQTLSLTLEEQEIEEDVATLLFSDPTDYRIEVIIERQTETVTRVRFNVGSSRNEGYGVLFGQQIIEELKKGEGFVVDWSDEPEDDR